MPITQALFQRETDVVPILLNYSLPFFLIFFRDRMAGHISKRFVALGTDNNIHTSITRQRTLLPELILPVFASIGY